MTWCQLTLGSSGTGLIKPALSIHTLGELRELWIRSEISEVFTAGWAKGFHVCHHLSLLTVPSGHQVLCLFLFCTKSSASSYWSLPSLWPTLVLIPVSAFLALFIYVLVFFAKPSIICIMLGTLRVLMTCPQILLF